MNLTIAIYGRSDTVFSENDLDKAKRLGESIASIGAQILTAQFSGFVQPVIKNHRNSGGVAIGISSAKNRTEHNDQLLLPTDICDVVIYSGLGNKASVDMVNRSCDAIIFGKASIRTNDEFRSALINTKIIGLLEDDDIFDELIDEVKFSGKIIRLSDPEELINQIVKKAR